MLTVSLNKEILFLSVLINVYISIPLFQLEINLEKVISITREKMALFIPNAIGIQTADKKVTLLFIPNYWHSDT